MTDTQIEASQAGSPVAQHGLTGHSHGSGYVPDTSRAERRRSFDAADFAVPGGREEEWRFTPLDRVADLHTGVAASGPAHTVQTEVPDGVTVETVGRDDPR